MGEVLKGVQGAEPDRGLLVAKLLDGPGVAVGDQALLAKLKLVATICSGLGDLVAGGPDLLEGHIGTDACSGQDQHAAETLQQRSTASFCSFSRASLNSWILAASGLSSAVFTSLRSLSVRDGYIHLGTQNT